MRYPCINTKSKSKEIAKGKYVLHSAHITHYTILTLGEGQQKNPKNNAAPFDTQQ
jgi:hypothetical protein